MYRSALDRSGRSRRVERIEHHIQEEEGEMFRVARGIFSREELRELASEMLAVREQSVRS